MRAALDEMVAQEENPMKTFAWVLRLMKVFRIAGEQSHGLAPARPWARCGCGGESRQTVCVSRSEVLV